MISFTLRIDFAMYCFSTENLFIREAMATEVLIGKNDSVEGVRTFFGMDFYAPSVVLTTGTFMSGKIWVGRTSMPAGRAGESASHGLTENLQQLGFETDRLKTGTPPRIDSRTVDFSGLEPQHGDEEVYIVHTTNFIVGIFLVICTCRIRPSYQEL
jgi:tRNA uridine 5-carboxymethylaminomethyl modification enzyme